MTQSKQLPGKSKPGVSTLNMDELENIIGRAQSAGLPEDDCDKLRCTIESLAWVQQELANKSVTIAGLRSLFGIHKSENTRDVLGDNKPSAAANGDRDGSDDSKNPAEPGAGQGKEKKGKPKPKGHGRKSADDYEGGERVEVPHDSLESGGCCPSCTTPKRGKVYEVGKPKTLIRVVGQAPLHATVYELQRLRCNLCGEVFAAEPPPGIGDKKYDATAASMIGLLKYGSGLPFHRLEKLQGNLKIPLPASTQWDIVREAASELEPIHKELIRQAAQGRLLHNDDTTMRVLDLRKEINELKKTGKTDRTGIFTTGIVSELSDERRVVLYFTGRQHAGENIADVLAHRSTELDKPIQMCDALDHNLPSEFETVVANCLAHARRKFVEVVNSFPDECRYVLESLRDVYIHDSKARRDSMSDQERLSYHQNHSGPLMDELKIWMNKEIEEKRVEPNSKLGQAIIYMTKRWNRMTLFLRVAGAPLDNNIVERTLKKAILHRKNAMFYKTSNGAHVGDLFMSLIQTAEHAGGNSLEYLTALLTYPAAIARDPHKWLPWNYTEELGKLSEPAAAST